MLAHVAEDPTTASLVDRYIARLALSDQSLRVTTERRLFETWLGRRVSGAIGGAFVFMPRAGMHTILINLPRINLANPKALEIVVAEELLHMRDHIDGDRRRHAKHGYDRIAHRVAELTCSTLEEVRSCLLPTTQRPFLYVYTCPSCGVDIQRKRRGTWSCGRCASGFDRRLVLRLTRMLK